MCVLYLLFVTRFVVIRPLQHFAFRPCNTTVTRNKSLNSAVDSDGSRCVHPKIAIEHIGALEARRTSLLDRLHHARRLLPSSHPALQPSPVPESIIVRRKGRFVTPLPMSVPGGGITSEEIALYDEGCAEYDVRMYDVPIWGRIWDGGTGLPIAGMGLPKGPIKGSGRGGSGSYGTMGGSGGGTVGGGDEEDEESEEE